MPIKDQDNLTIVRAAAGKLLPENPGDISTPNDVPAQSEGQIDAPNDVDSEAVGAISAPNELTPIPELRVGGATLLCGVNLENVGVTSTGAVVTSPENAFNHNTFERAILGSNLNGFPPFGVEFEQEFEADTIAISIHNIGSTGGEIGDVLSNGPDGSVTWNNTPFTVSRTNDTIVIKIDKAVKVDQITIGIGKQDGYEVFIGNIMIGKRIDMPPIYGGHAPTTLNRTTRYENNSTGTGNWVGRSVKKRGYNGAFSFQRMDPLFVRNRIAPFLDCIERKPFVIQWRPDKFPSEAIYCWTTDDPQVSNMGGGHDLMQMSFNVEAYRGV